MAFNIQQVIERYLNDKKLHVAYDETTKLADKVRVHVRGEKPGALLTDRRPSEPEEIKEYREKIFVPITKQVCAKVINSLSKIRRSPDWNPKYTSDLPKVINEEETLEKYCEQNYPNGYTSLTNWLFSVLLQSYLVDPNGVVLVMPLSFEVEQNEYVKPFPFIFESDSVYEFIDGELAVLKAKEKSKFKVGETWNEGDIFYIVNQTTIFKVEQISNERDNKWAVTPYEHGLGELPAFRMRAVFLKQMDATTVWESRLSAMLPSLDEAVREYSDMQATVVTYMFPEKWQLETQSCAPCSGTGKVHQRQENGTVKTVTCKDCKGTGSPTASPYAVLKVKLPNVPAGSIPPLPPFGYGEKDTSIVELQRKRIEQHKFDALSAVHMQHSDEVPLAESGVSKAQDKDEANNYVHSVAEDIVWCGDRIYVLTSKYRYRVVLLNTGVDAEDLVPTLPVPEKFDLSTSLMLADEIKAAKDAKVNSRIVANLEREYIGKKFSSQKEQALLLDCAYDLDPLGGLTEDEKMTRLSNKGIQEADYVLSSNIDLFVRKAFEEKGASFFEMSWTDKRELLLSYVEETQTVNEEKAEAEMEREKEMLNVNFDKAA